MIFNYSRRESTEVSVGITAIGGSNPVRVQSMTNTSTLDTESSIAQILRIARAGGELVRLTTQGEREAANMETISKGVRQAGCHVPLVADVHFNPKAAFMAARYCEKVRINPGNFADAVHQFHHIDYTDEEYAAEVEEIRNRLLPFLQTCSQHNTAIRLGVNHGSLSDRIMSRYGDTPEGMVESVMDYLRVCHAENFRNVVISIKASNVTVMVATVRLLADTMEKEGMRYPLHLGVTEAGNEEEGRIKSAAGIGALLAYGLGDTIRVSLSEEPEEEIPVAITLRDHIAARENHPPVAEPLSLLKFPARDSFNPVAGHEKTPWPVIETLDFSVADTGAFFTDASDDPVLMPDDTTPVMLSSCHINPVGEIASWIERFGAGGGRNPVIIRLRYDDTDPSTATVKAAADFGALLLAGYGNGIRLEIPALSMADTHRIALGILQAVRLRMSRPEYIACPGCGRTLFNLQQTLARIKEATKEMTGLKIGVMGCIVNGPGEMADADYGYVGAGPGRISLYKGRTLIRKNIPEADAVKELLSLIASSSD